MARLKYKTQAVNTAIDPAGGFFCRVVNADPVEDDAVFRSADQIVAQCRSKLP